MADYASVVRKISAALSSQRSEMANWVTTEEAKDIVKEAQAANDPRADLEVAKLASQGRPNDPQVYSGNGPRWSPNTWSSFEVERETRPPPPSGSVWMDAPESTRFPGSVRNVADQTQALNVLNQYLVDADVAASKNIGSLWSGDNKKKVDGRTFLVAPGESLSFELPDASHRRAGEIQIQPAGPEIRRGGTFGYTPRDRLPIRGASIVIPRNASGTEYTVKAQGVTFKVRVP